MQIQVNKPMDNEFVRKIVSERIKPGHRFELPKGENIVHLVGVSGGADSAVTALLCRAFFPEVHFLFLMTDTGEEAHGTKEALDRIGEVTGNPVTIIEPDEPLYDYIERMGSYLPSARSRFCTTSKKILPYQQFITNLQANSTEEISIASYVGLRADEPTRMGATYSNSNINNYFPLRELGLNKRDVFHILEKTIGIPEFYRYRSRSGCTTCPFSRRSEQIMLSAKDIRSYMRAAQLENLPDKVVDSLMELPTPLSYELGVGRNHLVFPKPARLFSHPDQTDIPVSPLETNRSKVSKISKDDIFGHKSIFVAIHATRYWCWNHWQLSNEHIVVYSTSLAGLKKSVKFYWHHLLNTRELFGARSEKDLLEEHKIIMYEIALEDPDRIFGLDLEDAYTWQSDRQPMLLIRKMVSIVEKILLSAEINHRQQEGELTWMGEYQPTPEAELERDFDIEDEVTACYVCSR